MSTPSFAAMSPEARLIELIRLAMQKGVLRRVSAAKSSDPSVRRATFTPRHIGGREVLQLELFTADNKAFHRNFSSDEIENGALSTALASYGQVNVLTTLTVDSDCECKRSARGQVTLLRGDRLYRALLAAKKTQNTAIPHANNRQKQYILDGSEPFLQALDISDKNGRVYDKKQSKFRQINRFLELLRDVEDQLPKEGDLVVCDLCCGKSYLSFAVYHYLTAVRGRTVRMTGVDLKPDVIEHCSRVASAAHMDGLHFLCGDVATFAPCEHVHLVVSLHACDIATDLVLDRALAFESEVILSTPCCHHELNHTLDCPELSCIAEYSMLRQKLCDAATDALRLLRLRAAGYTTAALELIDPDETPKNILLRALRQKHPSPATIAAAKQEYEDAVRFFIRTPGTAQDTFLARGTYPKK